MTLIKMITDGLNLPQEYIPVVQGAVVVLALLMIVLVILWIAGFDPMRKFFHRYRFFSVLLKVGALAGTWFLAQCDYYSVYTVFQYSFDLDRDQVAFLGYTFAAFLEGFAFLLGIFLSKALDTTSYRDSAQRFNWIGSLICGTGLVAAWSLAVAQRYNLIRLDALEWLEEGTVLTFWQVVRDAEPENIFMMVSPILTSVLAFGLSWLAFPSYSLKQQANDVEYHLERYLRFRARYEKKLMAYQQKKARLWTALCGADESDLMDMPADSNIYQSRCQQQIRQKTVNACVSAFSGEFGRYNKRIEAELSSYILELSERSTLKHLISGITVEEVLEKYEELVNEKELDGDLWDSQKLRQDKKARLQRELSNAACQAEFWFSPNRKK